jgi:hypothetical protein
MASHDSTERRSSDTPDSRLPPEINSRGVPIRNRASFARSCNAADSPRPSSPSSWLHSTGAKLGRGNLSDYCSACVKRQPRVRSDIEAERVLFDRAIAMVLGGVAKSRRRRHRVDAA